MNHNDKVRDALKAFEDAEKALEQDRARLRHSETNLASVQKRAAETLHAVKSNRKVLFGRRMYHAVAADKLVWSDADVDVL